MLCSPVANLVNEKLPVLSVMLFHSSDRHDDAFVVMAQIEDFTQIEDFKEEKIFFCA